ncbi:MAG: peptidase, partial [Bacteroidota bacterium]
MRTTLVLSLWITALFIGCSTAQQVSQSPPTTTIPQKDPYTAKTEKLKAYEGYFDFFYDEKTGKIMLSIDKFDQEFLYVNSLTAGVGSNDIGLDRGQLGNTRVVKFIRSGPKVMLIQPNQRYRAVSNNADEKRSVEEAFAQSVIWG